MISGTAQNLRNRDESAYSTYRSGHRNQRVKQMISTGDDMSSVLKGRRELC